MNDEIQQTVKKLANEADKRAADELIEKQIKFMAAAYDKGIAYTNLIIIAGYASFFGLWQITKEYLSEQHVLWSALLIAISATFFVLFEVSKMFNQSRKLLKMNRIITSPEVSKSFELMSKAFDQYNQEQNKQQVVWGLWWHFAWIVSVFSGVGAIGVLMWAFVSGLLKP